MPRTALALIALSALAACTPPAEGPPLDSILPAPPDGPPGLALMEGPLPPPDGPCYRSGESDVTREWLDDMASLVSCPPGVDLAALSPFGNAYPVATHQGWTLYSVPYQP